MDAITAAATSEAGFLPRTKPATIDDLKRQAARTKLELEAQLPAKQQAVADAERALQDAQLAAVTAGRAIPGHVADGVADARRALSELQGAIAAFDRHSDAELNEARRRNREAALAVAQRSAEAVLKAARAALAEAQEMAARGAVAKLKSALEELRRQTASAHASTLTPGGWEMQPQLGELRQLDLALLAANLATAGLRGQGQEQLGYIEKLATGSFAAMQMQQLTFEG